MRIARRDINAPEEPTRWHVCLAVIGRRLLLQLELPAVLAKRVNINPTRHKPPASLVLLATSAPNLPQLPSLAAALLFTVLQRVPLLTLRRRDTTPPQLLLPMKRESANYLARLVSLAWEESSLSASRVLPTSPTLLKVPASPAQRVLPEPTKPQPVPPHPTLSVNHA